MKTQTTYQEKLKTTFSTVPIYSLKLVKAGNIKYPVDTVRDCRQAESVLRVYLEDKDCEHLAVVLLDGHNNMIGISTISIGGIACVQVAMRDIFKFAINGRASAMVLGHNHPSGNTEPSHEDIVFTKRVKAAGELMGIPLVDHVIISSGFKKSTYSFCQHNMEWNKD